MRKRQKVSFVDRSAEGQSGRLKAGEHDMLELLVSARLLYPEWAKYSDDEVLLKFHMEVLHGRAGFKLPGSGGA